MNTNVAIASAAPALLPANVPALEAERRALLGDSRSVDRLDGPQLARFVAICAELRSAARAAGKIAPHAGKRQSARGLDIADL